MAVPKDRQVRHHGRLLSLSVMLLLTPIAGTGSGAFANDLPLRSEGQIAQHAKAAWEQGTLNLALGIVEQGIQDHPRALALHQLRGDMLATSRQTEAALESYETVLASIPAALDVRWAKWSVLVRSGQVEEAVAELQRIAVIDPHNPLLHLRLARELRKLDRLEESFEAYQKAVELGPDMLNWRLALARARFDVLDYEGAERDVQFVLDRVPPGSPLHLSARNLLTVFFGSTERGRRFAPVMTPDVSPKQLRDWSMIRAEGYRLFEAGRFREAEPVYRELLRLNPMDPLAGRHLSLILMGLGRCKDALAVSQAGSEFDPTDEEHTTTAFRMGQCMVELGRWEDAYMQFKTLYDATVEFEKSTKDVQLPSGTRVLNKANLVQWLEKVRLHVPEFAQQVDEDAAATAAQAKAAAPTIPPEAELAAKAIEALKPQNTLDPAASLVGRDADFAWFRFVIPAKKVMRDDSPTGAHDFIPLDPGISFPGSQQDIYLVFSLVTASYDEVPLAARCFKETAELAGAHTAVAQDRLIMSTNDQSGYFVLPRPATGWTAGLYRCGLFAGEETSAYTQVDEVRFRIIEPTRPS
ncbi:MAG TPA: tetratricopeptide repeat protein [Nitrospira sp.]|nr:tetratricopeptide repeat protein [Nitrospira sp.]HMU30469.1 tetratricopeptide repeat protein [Nitrospira sp.]HMV55953.1 tetratricopeptide repeat protein [Nitrospira sp.]HMW85100.1 tetratricopeptide repeat protein [Nitrospira sp.]HMX91205.1 tetratricopeptide repeat protein [Nitrospira sp.]